MWSRFRTLVAGCFLAVPLLSGDAVATAGEDAAGDASGATNDVQEARRVLDQLERQDAELAREIPHAKGVFIVPDYATAALLIGGSGGEGILMVQQDGQWGSPGFYDIGNIDIGPQMGGAAGSLVFVLKSAKAVDLFRAGTKFSLTTQAGLTLVNWSAETADNRKKGDALIWSNTEGLLAEASAGVGAVAWDEEEARQYYNQTVSAEQVIAGEVVSPRDNVLQSELAAFTRRGSHAGESSAGEDAQP